MQSGPRQILAKRSTAWGLQKNARRGVADTNKPNLPQRELLCANFHGDELSAEGARWREAGASVVQDLSDVLGHVARSDFSLGCGNGA